MKVKIHFISRRMWRERVSKMEIKITGNKKIGIINRMNNISKVIEKR